MNSFSQFFTVFLQPVFDLFTRLISLPIFGVPLYQILLSFFVLAFVIGFISSGTALGGGMFEAGFGLLTSRSGSAASQSGSTQKSSSSYRPSGSYMQRKHSEKIFSSSDFDEV